ncbi:MAG: hypothetical protein ABSC06_05380 [Rhodopila sp.]|jgi:hypothetical protein
MKLSALANLALLLVFASAPARAQTDQPDADAMRAGVMELLSMVTLGAISTQDQAVEVTRSAADYHVRIPLKGLAAPVDAALEAVVRPLGGGVWYVSSMTFPAAGTIDPSAPAGGISRMEYSIGEQSIHAQVDPGFGHQSTAAADFGMLRLSLDQGEVHSEQEIARYVVDTTVSAETAGRIDFASHAKATDWHFSAHAPNGINTDSVARGLSAHVSAEGLDRAQATRLLAAMRAFLAAARPATTQASATPPAAPPQPRTISPAERQTLRAMADAVPGLLTRFNMEESVDGIRFNAGSANTGTIEHVRIAIAGESAGDRLSAHMDIGLDELAMPNLPADTAAYLPHHIEVRSVLAGLPTGALTTLLHAAAEPDTDRDAVRGQMTALLAAPDARIGIQSFSFDSGPMRITGSVRFVGRADGETGTDIHVSATGMETFMAAAQGDPTLQKALPAMFMAKGMGRPDGGAIAWDIALGGGPMTVNGMPFGQPPGKTR